MKDKTENQNDNILYTPLELVEEMFNISDEDEKEWLELIEKHHQQKNNINKIRHINSL